MTKTDFINVVAEKTLTHKGEEKRITKNQANEIYDIIFGNEGAIQQGLRMDNEVKLPGFGTLYLADAAEREFRNPQTGEVIVVPARKAVRFRPATALKNVAK